MQRHEPRKLVFLAHLANLHIDSKENQISEPIGKNLWTTSWNQMSTTTSVLKVYKL